MEVLSSLPPPVPHSTGAGQDPQSTSTESLRWAQDTMLAVTCHLPLSRRWRGRCHALWQRTAEWLKGNWLKASPLVKLMQKDFFKREIKLMAAGGGEGNGWEGERRQSVIVWSQAGHSGRSLLELGAHCEVCKYQITASYTWNKCYTPTILKSKNKKVKSNRKINESPECWSFLSFQSDSNKHIVLNIPNKIMLDHF